MIYQEQAPCKYQQLTNYYIIWESKILRFLRIQYFKILRFRYFGILHYGQTFFFWPEIKGVWTHVCKYYYFVRIKVY